MNGFCDGCGCSLNGEFDPSYTHEISGLEWCHGDPLNNTYKSMGCYGKEMSKRAEVSKQFLLNQDKYYQFWQQQSQWSQETFGSDSEWRPLGPTLHLQKEVKGALDELDQLKNCQAENPQVHMVHFQRELVDCFFLVTDAARRSGLTYEQFMKLAFEKLEINKARKWNKPISDQPVEHDRSEE